MLRRLRNSPELRFAGPVILENTATVFIGLVFSTIIGGISVRVGSDLYDGTVLRRLTEARKAFAK